jgi:hypothetical protein
LSVISSSAADAGVVLVDSPPGKGVGYLVTLHVINLCTTDSPVGSITVTGEVKGTCPGASIPNSKRGSGHYETDCLNLLALLSAHSRLDSPFLYQSFVHHYPKRFIFTPPDKLDNKKTAELQNEVTTYCVVYTNNVPTSSVVPTSIEIDVTATGTSASGQDVTAPAFPITVNWS